MYLSKQIALLHTKPIKWYITATGAGSGVQRFLTFVPGGSNTIIGCEYPYSREALWKFLGHKTEACCSLDIAAKMAKESLLRGRALVDGNVVGVGITATIETNRILHGKHRAYIALDDGKKVLTMEVEFQKDRTGKSMLGRIAESGHVDMLTINMMFHYTGIPTVPIHPYGVTSEQIGLAGNIIPKQTQYNEYPQIFWLDGKITGGENLSPDKYVLFPGSFNPMHDGHRHLIGAAEKYTKKTIMCMLEVSHPDKGDIPHDDVVHRAKQMEWHHSLLVTKGLGLFIEKARKYPGYTFLMGMDTLERMLDPKYAKMPTFDLLDVFYTLKTSFLVARRPFGGKIKTLDDVLHEHKCTPYYSLFKELETYHNASSTELRNK